MNKPPVSKKFNNIMLANLGKYPDFTFRFRIKELLEERNLTMQDLSNLTGLRPSAISILANNRSSTYNLSHLTLIMTTLHITNLSDLIVTEMSLATRKELEKPFEMTPELEAQLEENRNYLLFKKSEDK